MVKLHSPFRSRVIDGVYYKDAHNYLHRKGFMIYGLLFGIILQMIFSIPYASALCSYTVVSSVSNDTAVDCFGEWYSGRQCWRLYDNSGATWGEPANGNISYTYTKYTPAYFPYNVTMKLKYSGSQFKYNLPAECLHNDGYFEINYTLSNDPNRNSNVSCMNYTSGYYSVFGTPTLQIYEVWYDFYYADCIPLAQDCDSYFVGLARCGGYNMQFVLNCSNYSGNYRWNDTRVFCEDGCIDGECQTFSQTCIDRCEIGETTCFGNYIVNCTNETYSGCNNWNDEYQEHCPNGCLNGACIENVSTCAYGDQICDGDSRMNCTFNTHSYWSFSQLEVCEYSCGMWYENDTTYCTEIGDAHTISDSLEEVGFYFSFIFSSFLTMAFLIFCLIGTFVVTSKTKDSGGSSLIGPIFLIGLVVAGQFIVPGFPIWITIVVVVIGLTWVFKGGNR
jgi:hypothetical protein